MGQVPSGGDILYKHYIKGVHVPKLQKVTRSVHRWLYQSVAGDGVIARIGTAG